MPALSSIVPLPRRLPATLLVSAVMIVAPVSAAPAEMNEAGHPSTPKHSQWRPTPGPVPSFTVAAIRPRELGKMRDLTDASTEPGAPFEAPQGSKPHIWYSFAMILVILAATLLSYWQRRRFDHARAALAASEARAQRKSDELTLTLEHIGQGIIMVDARGEVVVANDKAAAMLDLPAPFGGHTGQFNDVVDQMFARGEFGSLTQAGGQVAMRQVRALPPGLDRDCYERKRPDGTVLSVRTHRTPDGGFVRTITDVTERRRSEEEIAHLARHDTLTSLANRKLFREKLDKALGDIDKTGGCSVMFIDLDDFKNVNDAHGQRAGDGLLRSVGLRLRSAVRAEDVVARLGGDEFAVLMSGLVDPKLTEARAQHLIEVLRETHIIADVEIPATANLGYAIAPRHGATAKEILRCAELALQSAKADGPNACRQFAPEMSEQLNARRRLEADLAHAIEKGQLELHYQPLISIDTGSLCGFEALLRWNHPVQGRISPMDFIPIAEESGLIVPIGLWVIDAACQEAAKWDQNLRIAVNLSPLQFREASLVNDIKSALERNNLSPERLELEITETVMMQHGEQTVSKLNKIKELGVKVSMDDFGTGYSSLNYLRNFAFDKIKIDRSFINELGQGNECDAIVRAIISLADCLSVSTTAEGVETVEQLDALRAMGCREAQGYLFSPPKPVGELQNIISASCRDAKAMPIYTASNPAAATFS